MDHLSDKYAIQEYRNKIDSLEKKITTIYPRKWHKIKWQHTKQYRDSLPAKIILYESKIKECQIYISLLGG